MEQVGSMKRIPSDDPYAFQERIMSALIGDIRDRKARGFPRLNAIREINEQAAKEAKHER